PSLFPAAFSTIWISYLEKADKSSWPKDYGLSLFEHLPSSAFSRVLTLKQDLVVGSVEKKSRST
ncbi:hypothetical protein K1719_047132, partial [Acacia pycnantha]